MGYLFIAMCSPLRPKKHTFIIHVSDHGLAVNGGKSETLLM